MNISKINNANAAKIYAEASKKLNEAKPADGEKQAKAVSADLEKSSVNILREAKSMNVLDFAKERIKADMGKDIPADRISQLKSAIKSGAYNVSVDAIASAVINGKS